MSINGKIIRNIILAIVTLGLLLGAYFWAVKWKPEDKEVYPFAEKTLIFGLEPDEITKVVLKNSSGKLSIEKAKNEEGLMWCVPEKENVKFSQNKLEETVFACSKIYAEKEIGKNIENLKDFGVENEETSVTIYDRNNSAHTFIIGDKVRVDSTYYFMEKGTNTVYTVSGYVADNMLRSYNDFRETRLGSIDITNIDKFTLSKAGKQVMVIKRNENMGSSSEFITSDMMMTYPYEEQVRIDLFEKMFVSFLDNIEVVEFTSDDMSDAFEYGIDSGYKIEVYANKSKHSLTLGNIKENKSVYAVYNDFNFIFTMNAKELIDTLKNLKPFDLVQKFAHIYNIENVKSVDVYANDKTNTLSIEKNGEKKTYSINGKTVSDADFKKVFQSIIGLSWTGVLDNEAKVGKKVCEITFNLADGTVRKATYQEYDERNFAVLKPDGKKYLILKKYITGMLENFENY